ncbi:MAG: hypothetical protein M0P12_00790 [Paludibacteraceae bacterium]|nr:hypothetical protein [Paludibacteraceae bacterium]
MNVLSSERANALIDDFLTPKLLRFRQIEVNDEPLKLDSDRKTWLFAFGNVLETAPLRIVRANEKMMPDSFEIDPQMGKLTFPDVNSSFQIISGNDLIDTVDAIGNPLIDVSASYSFDYFPAEVLYGFLVSSINTINSAGQDSSPTYYTIENCPDYWAGVIVDLAFAQCMERLLLDYDLWKGRLIFAIGADMLLEGQGGDIVSQLSTLKQNAEDRAYKTIDNPVFKAGGRLLAYPTNYYWRAVSGVGTSGTMNVGGRLRGWRVNRLGR